MALLLGPATEYHLRVRAARRLSRQGTELLPLLLNTLSTHPEITRPVWPGWPPQYEHCSRLLIQMGQQAHLSLHALLHHPALSSPAGPVLWTSLVEAAGLHPYHDNEELLRLALETPWEGTRYAAAMSLATRAKRVFLQAISVEALRAHIGVDEALPVRLTAAYALLCSRDPAGMETLSHFLEPQEEEEARKAAVFMFATELPFRLIPAQREGLALRLMRLMRDTNPDIALHAAHTLSKIAWPTLIALLSNMLSENDEHIQIAVLICLEEIAHRESLHEHIQQSGLPGRILLLLRNDQAEVRRQAGYTLAACGGEYALGALGTILLRQDHPGHLEAIESLRQLHGALRTPTRLKVLRWLLQLLRASADRTQITALDSLTYLFWQARIRGQKRAWHEMGNELINDGMLEDLLYSQNAWVRQRTVELLRLLVQYPHIDRKKAEPGQEKSAIPLDSVRETRLEEMPNIGQRLLHLLQYDEDSGVRACVAYTFGQFGTNWTTAALIRALTDVDRQVALTALNALEASSTADDLIAVYAIQELTRYGLHDDPAGKQLVLKAKEVLKKFRKSAARMKKQLQGSG